MRRAQKSRPPGLFARLLSFLPGPLGRPFKSKQTAPAVQASGGEQKTKTGDSEEDTGPKDFKYWFNQYWRKVGGGSLSVSIGIHLAGILIALFIITSTGTEPAVDFLPGGGSKGSQDASSDVAHQVQRKRATFVDRPLHKVVSNSALTAIKLNDLPLDMPIMPPLSSLIDTKSDSSMGLGSSGSGGGHGNGIGTGGRSGFTSMPPAFSSRCSNIDRLQKLKESGGTPECETAVSKSLQWLKSKQNPDGSWGSFFKCGMTGFALLCYLGHCETTDSPYFGEQVKKGFLYLLEMQKKNRYNVISANPGSNFSTYEHGICTYALGELYGLSHTSNGGALSSMAQDAFEKGVRVILDNQMADGGWAYSSGRGIAYAKEGEHPDLSVTGWQYQALKAARHSGLNISGVNPAIEKTVKYLESTQTQDGGFGVAKRESSYNQWNLSGVALLGLETLSHVKSPALPKGMNFAIKLFINEPPDWHRNADLYCWYYYSQAFFQNGGREWQYWNEKVLHQLLENQTKEGSWSPEGFSQDIGSVSGSSSYAGVDQPIYRVALCTLMLEIYYRYLKVGEHEKGSVFDRK